MNIELPNKKRKISDITDEPSDESSDEDIDHPYYIKKHAQIHPHYDAEWTDDENLDDLCDYPDEDEFYSM
jgi:hypothetical protein